MRAYERDLFSYLCSISDEWHSKTRKSIGLYAAVKLVGHHASNIHNESRS